MNIETQWTVGRWGASTFGDDVTVKYLAERAHDEMLELLTALARDPDAQKEATQDEAADVAIFLLRLAAVSGFNLLAAVDRKMAVNRKRRWEKQADGTWLKVQAVAK